ncbi:hypothetical protein GGE45_002923 [Rhizobium aethiopicum]|uniref:DUF6894 domain-containing protein n=1 Tax=Rhizobium aethiopicum TaxID=1138170 RepID=A0A7W6MGL2_9HYPH|nr:MULTISPECIES: hypothetical protein [Rhizobium]MBB4191356.1 hypothetical protein [Rhizobium aethiopicum]MBB4580588.1 hypothetical protein [Rhizobium aethiopicum]MDO3432885.1 hypothetical protein [Rhizobium sp. CBN3]
MERLEMGSALPTYYFHIKHADHIVLDPDGEMFLDLNAAREEAGEALRELVGRAILSNQKELPQAIEIRDVHGHLAAEVHIDAAIPQIAHRKRDR